MTEHDSQHVGGKGFAPSERNVAEADDETTPTTTHGSGKQFAKDVGDPDHDPRARQTEGSGKQFAKDVQGAEEEAHGEHSKGSGKQFEPGRDEL